MTKEVSRTADKGKQQHGERKSEEEGRQGKVGKKQGRERKTGCMMMTKINEENV